LDFASILAVWGSQFRFLQAISDLVTLFDLRAVHPESAGAWDCQNWGWFRPIKMVILGLFTLLIIGFTTLIAI
jgi:hypothetical protein